jgi:hypothetical protein
LASDEDEEITYFSTYENSRSKDYEIGACYLSGSNKRWYDFTMSRHIRSG